MSSRISMLGQRSSSISASLTKNEAASQARFRQSDAKPKKQHEAYLTNEQASAAIDSLITRLGAATTAGRPSDKRKTSVAQSTQKAPAKSLDPHKEAQSVQPISVEQLLKIQPSLGDRATTIAADLNTAFADAEIIDSRAQAMFTAQILHEIGAAADLHENGGKKKYRGKIYDYFFYMYDKGSPNPGRQRVASSLGNTEFGDGARFHGRGYIQLTGRNNYTRAGIGLGLDLVSDPDLAAVPSHAVRIAGWFWRNGNGDLNQLATKDENFEAVTRRINGGLNGIEGRKALYEKAKKALNVK